MGLKKVDEDDRDNPQKSQKNCIFFLFKFDANAITSAGVVFVYLES